ncbi:MAG: patatin-like phospholipase family protein [Deltaproteobacteria bacterium]|nr:patatin-like phospholipase family protein [Deltaproteobacteria bacterium]
MDAERHLEIRAPLDQLEAEVVRRDLAHPEEIGRPRVEALRYVLSFARSTVVRNRDGQDVEVAETLVPFARRVRSTLEPLLAASQAGLWDAARALPELVAATRAARADLLDSMPLDRDSLEEEVTRRLFVVACGGGGGSGFGYAGAWMLFYRHDLQPALIAGTSMGAIIGLFRARRRRFDMAAMVDAGRRISWPRMFRLLEGGSRYGLPASVRLALHPTLGACFQDPSGRPYTLADLEIPMRIVVTGLRLGALQHDLSYYEHFLDEVVREGFAITTGRLRRVANVVQLVRELLRDPSLLREVVFGADPVTREADVLDAVGFSAAVPGIIHYDVVRDDPRMCDLLDRVFAEFDIVRLTEGGLVDNVPARVAWEAVMRGDLGRRNAFVLAMDCFAPRAMSLLFYPLQQAIRPMVLKSTRFAHLYFPLERVLSPVHLTPDLAALQRCMGWTTRELKPHLPFLKAMCATLPVLQDG